MPQEHLSRPAQQSLLPPVSPQAFVTHMESRYVALFTQRYHSPDLAVTKEEQVLGTILHEARPSRWRLTPLPGLIYQRERFKREEQASMPEAEFILLDSLFASAIDVYTTSSTERQYFENKQRQRRHASLGLQ